jgi:SNF2 family DNA or RNA helicase
MQKAILITRFSRMAHILKRELAKWNPLVITGETQNRQEILKKFEEDPQYRILIGSEAIGQGLNLQKAANILINVDLPWNPARLEQRIGRIHRNGQEKPVFVYNLVQYSSIT